MGMDSRWKLFYLLVLRSMSIGLIFCKDMERSFVDYVIQDYNKPMGVATYKTAKDMSEELKNALPDIEELKKLLDSEEMPDDGEE